MIDPKKLQEIEQASAALAETYPPMWRRIYENCLSEGFTEQQAFAIVLMIVSSTFRSANAS